MPDKLCPLGAAIRGSRLRDGASVVMGACLEPDIPFAATYEIIRQGIRGLDVIAPISDASTDMLIGAGCVAQVTGAWVGNVSGGLGHNYRRAFEAPDGPRIALRDHSNFSLGMALLAGAYGMPYVPLRSLLGSDILRSNPAFRAADNPFTEGPDPIVLVPPLVPDVAILPVQRADRFGNCHHWGSRGVVQEAALAAERVDPARRRDRRTGGDRLRSQPGPGAGPSGERRLRSGGGCSPGADDRALASRHRVFQRLPPALAHGRRLPGLARRVGLRGGRSRRLPCRSSARACRISGSPARRSPPRPATRRRERR